MTDETWQAPDDTGHPDLSALLRAELTNAEVSAVGRHLYDCDVCRHDLVDFAVGHALLARTARTLRPAVPAARHAATSTAPPLPPSPLEGCAAPYARSLSLRPPWSWWRGPLVSPRG